MQNTLAIILFLNASFQPAMAPDVMPRVMSEAQCRALADDEEFLTRFRKEAQQTEPKVAHVMIGCKEQSPTERSSLGRSLMHSVE